MAFIVILGLLAGAVMIVLGISGRRRDKKSVTDNALLVFWHPARNSSAAGGFFLDRLGKDVKVIVIPAGSNLALGDVGILSK